MYNAQNKEMAKNTYKNHEAHSNIIVQNSVCLKMHSKMNYI